MFICIAKDVPLLVKLVSLFGKVVVAPDTPRLSAVALLISAASSISAWFTLVVEP